MRSPVTSSWAAQEPTANSQLLLDNPLPQEAASLGKTNLEFRARREPGVPLNLQVSTDLYTHHHHEGAPSTTMTTSNMQPKATQDSA